MRKDAGRGANIIPLVNQNALCYRLKVEGFPSMHTTEPLIFLTTNICYNVCKVGSIAPKPRRDILMTDFEVVETADFPS